MPTPQGDKVCRLALSVGSLIHDYNAIPDDTIELMRNHKTNWQWPLDSEDVRKTIVAGLSGRYPASFINALRLSGLLKDWLPEVDALFGVPQPEQHHPEIDTGEHILLCLKEGGNRQEKWYVLFAVLLHDLGKGITPKEEWPKHRGHEEAGVPLVNAVCDRFMIGLIYRKLAVMVCRYHIDCHRVMGMNASTLRRKMVELDVLGKGTGFQMFLRACELDARGRKGLQDREYPQAMYFFEAARAVAAANPYIPEYMRCMPWQSRSEVQALIRNEVDALKAFINSKQPQITSEN